MSASQNVKDTAMAPRTPDTDTVRKGLKKSPRPRRIRETKVNIMILFWIYVILAIIGLIVLVPLIYIVAASFSDSSAVVSGKVFLWPVNPTLDAYKAVFNYPGIWLSYWNATYYTIATTVLSVVLTILFAYPLSRPGLYGRRLFNTLLLIAFLFSGGIVPLYIVVRSLGILNTPAAIILPTALSVFSVILARTFFRHSVPNELIEAAQIDGAGELRILWQIVVPLSKPIIAVLVLLAAVSSWNSYFNALIFLSSPDLFPLQLILREILVQNQLTSATINTLTPEQIAQFQNVATLLKYALIVVASLPLLAFYPFLQKYFVQGMHLGSLKE